MTQEVMSIHKALAELKIIDKRIEKTIADGTYCVANKHSNEKLGGVPIEEYKEEMKGSFDKAMDLIKRRNAIKRAVVQSNAVTKVKVSETDAVEYTVAEAIDMKNNGMEHFNRMLKALKNQYVLAQAEITKNNGERLDEKAEQYVVGLYGSREGKVDTDAFEKTKKEYIKAQTFELVDPIGIVKQMNELEEEIASFTANIDAALSVSNAITNIEVSY